MSRLSAADRYAGLDIDYSSSKGKGRAHAFDRSNVDGPRGQFHSRFIYIYLCDFDHLATVASGLSAYNSISSIDSYSGLDLSVQNHRHFPQAEHEYDISGFLSAGYGARNGLPETSLYRSMKAQVLLGRSEG